MSNRKIRVGITMGDPSGVGPTIIAKSISTIKNWAEIVVIGDEKVLSKSLNRAFKIPPDVKLVDLKNVAMKDFSFGKVSRNYGRAALDYLDRGLNLIKNDNLDCLVTCPVSKEAVNLTGIKFTGHTEYLARRTNTKDFLMLLYNKRLKFALVTRHIPLNRVSAQLSVKKITASARLAEQALRYLFLINHPRIVVCAINPHASDNGLIGREEKTVIRPAVDSLKKQRVFSDGPLPADSAIRKMNQKLYDCAVVMYHDQALIPLKLSDEAAVNLTVGLPFVRTSPLHGTGFDIAPFKNASPASFIEAVKQCIICAKNLRASS